MSVLRLFRFRPARTEFDATLRTILVPDLLQQPGIRAVVAGRIGPDNIGERLVASVWVSYEAMASAVGTDFEPARFHPELLGQSTDHRLDVLEVAVEIGSDRQPDVGIARLVTGRARASRLADYVTQARDGTLADRAAGRGPQRLYLATEPPVRFVTLSLWTGWSDVAGATGSDLERADRTRHEALLEDWTAEHFEVIPGIPAALLDAERVAEPDPA